VPIPDVENRLARAYTEIICNMPFFASILLRLWRQEDEHCQTMWTDGKNLGYSPTFVQKITHDELVGVLCHEVLHVTNLHPWRQGARKHKSWNIACDKAVNSIVKDSGLSLPKDVIPGVRDKAAEELYSEEDEKLGGGGGGWIETGGCGEVREPTNDQGGQISEAERELQEGEAKVMVQQALNAAKRAGKLPAGLERLVNEILEPKVPWKEILSRFIDGHAREDYCWSRPNARYMQRGIILPSLYSPGYGEVIMACDTSGSIDQKMLKEICSEVLGCLDMYQEKGQDPELLVLWCDTEVSAQTVQDADELRPRGGGGTSFAPVFRYIEKHGLQPKAVIYVTDGWCGDFGHEPPCPCLWVLTEKNRDFKPPFGEIACTLHE
jgi:predicted metal-dependent peptidase